MSESSPGGRTLGPPPYGSLRARLDAPLRALRDRGGAASAAEISAVLNIWWGEQLEWESQLIELLRLHHDINNALVGVSGNLQLMLRDPVCTQPGVRERLEVMLREAGRIRDAAGRLRELKTALQGGAGGARAA